MTVVTTSWVVAGDDGSGGETGLSLGEGNALVTGTEPPTEVSRVGTPGEERMDGGVALPKIGVIELSVKAAGVEGRGAIHLVQIVETTVFTTVDTVKELSIISRVPDVTVLITGQVVRVV